MLSLLLTLAAATADPANPPQTVAQGNAEDCAVLAAFSGAFLGAAEQTAAKFYSVMENPLGSGNHRVVCPWMNRRRPGPEARYEVSVTGPRYDAARTAATLLYTRSEAGFTYNMDCRLTKEGGRWKFVACDFRAVS